MLFFPNSCLRVLLCSTINSYHAFQVDEFINFFQRLVPDGYWVRPHNFGFWSIYLESLSCCIFFWQFGFVLHLLLAMGEECIVIRKVQYLQMFCQTPLDASLFIMGCLFHDPVSSEQEEERGKQAALFHTGEHFEFEFFLCTSQEESVALHIPVQQYLNDVDVFWRIP